MIPVRDVIPTRTRPAVSLAFAAAMGAAFAWPGVREWWLPWAASAAVLWLAGSTLEDRFGHGRFAAFTAACAAVAFVAPLAAGRRVDPVWALSATAAGVAVAYLVMFPRARMLVIVPTIIGIDIADVPAWVVVVLWAAVQAVAAWSALAWEAERDGIGLALSLVASAACGGLGGVLLRRPERMQVDWWDPPTRRP